MGTPSVEKLCAKSAAETSNRVLHQTVDGGVPLMLQGMLL